MYIKCACWNPVVNCDLHGSRHTTVAVTRDLLVLLRQAESIKGMFLFSYSSPDSKAVSQKIERRHGQTSLEVL